MAALFGSCGLDQNLSKLTVVSRFQIQSVCVLLDKPAHCFEVNVVEGVTSSSLFSFHKLFPRPANWKRIILLIRSRECSLCMALDETLDLTCPSDQTSTGGAFVFSFIELARELGNLRHAS